MNLAEGLTRLGNINAVRTALQESILGLEMLASAPTSASAIEETRTYLETIPLLRQLLESGPGVVEQGPQGLDWADVADRFGLYRGLCNAAKSSATRDAWLTALVAANNVADTAFAALESEQRFPEPDDAFRRAIRLAISSLRETYSQLSQNTSAEKADLEMSLRGFCGVAAF